MDLTAWMEQWDMLPPRGGIILCAVSGGRDSVCLLHYLHSISDRYGFSVAAGHYNHHMRPTAARDEDFVRQLCCRLDVPFYTAGADVVAAAAEAGCGVEEMGRKLRYAFLAQLADTIGASRIATAHHMGDQAETVLLNLLRGTGPEGLAGIPAVRGRLIRPLLDTPRQEIEAYLARHGLGHVEDETNESLRFARNRLRRVVMPELEKINPALRQHIARTAAIVGREDRYLDGLAAKYLPAEGVELACAELCAAPEALRPRVVRLLIERLGVGKKDFSAAHVDAVLSLAEKGRDGMANLPGGVCAVCRDGRLCLVLSGLSGPPAVALTEGVGRWGQWAFRVTVQTGAPEKENTLRLARKHLGAAVVDTWRGGEGLELSGSRGRRSVKRLLTERGVTSEERGAVPCIRVGGELAAVWGLGTDVHYLPEENGGMVEIIFHKTDKM